MPMYICVILIGMSMRSKDHFNYNLLQYIIITVYFVAICDRGGRNLFIKNTLRKYFPLDSFMIFVLDGSVITRA